MKEGLIQRVLTLEAKVEELDLLLTREILGETWRTQMKDPKQEKFCKKCRTKHAGKCK